MAAAALAFACGGESEQDSTALAITINANRTIHRYTLTCDPPGGTVPDPEAACALVEAIPSLVSVPAMTATCVGGEGIPPIVSVRGTANGTKVEVDGVTACQEPAARADAARRWLDIVGLDVELAVKSARYR